MLELADLFRRDGPADRATCTDRVLPSPLAAMEAMEPCRTAALGGHLSPGAACGALEDSDHSWKNRHGPTCQHEATTRWLAPHRARLLPVPSLLVPLTRPEALRPMVRAHPRWLSNRLLQPSAAAWPALALEPPSLGGQSGLVGVLHTWPRDLASHPHVHDLVPGGALSLEGSQWLSPRCDAWLVPVRARSKLCRGTCTAAWATTGRCDPVPPQVWHKHGVTHCPPAGTGTEVLTSCAPSLSRMALTTHRLETLADGPGTFRCKQRASAGGKRLTLPVDAFLHRFLPPGLPTGFPPVRSYGLLSPSRRTGLPHIRPRVAACLSTASAPAHAPRPPPGQPPPTAERRCRPCGGGLVVLGRLAPHPREPPEAQAGVRRSRGWSSMLSWFLSRPARPWRHGLTGLLWPAHDHPGETCRSDRPPRSSALVHNGSAVVRRHGASPLGSAGTAPLGSSAAPPSHCTSKTPAFPSPACSTQDGVAAGRHTNP
jgi:hypothetical protein